MNNNDHKSIKDNVLGAIETGKVIMRPKWHFLLQATLLVVGTVLSILTGIYLVSFIIFILHQTGVWFIPGFGGPRLLFTSLPWILVLIAIIFIILLEFLVKKYSFGYRKPLLYSTIGVILVVLTGGFVIAQTPLHRGLFDRARDHRLPIGGGFYRQFGMQRPPGNVAVGTVTEIIDKGFKISDPRGDIIDIIIDDKTEFPTGKDIAVDNHIVVLGQRQDSTVTADSIRKVEENDFPAPPGFRGRRPPPR
ncbi:MAG: hypothetical protein A3J07_02000 [Candidatus Doudnabacteria bacterium RIFCSPLOWO2_02_FULL_49_13]|uniref:Uncharacterized protein n=1 Tax=Candidatus Doudnabacteria bacterium RIFCSPHIGHO2_12_FULL_48_16 TaxID=1817838 RepID=A0A1F5PLF2_9BACT|nr:MAG: hypothetical protein A3B77_00710 [Candidatus Doudnabacteria bacterium RIFCSPHIGHO2_02_FULL_49_24]OGE88769.1 MAG: hypothetical protein A2760_01065 [Candidatus Doudnabacteria bacterium RIFCSPHIGHO2_01_FULL_50_67]OGE90709.1 MAG: hypothetical protein A3E29_01095 [Candidatus Doudnabacteria bacterium RIFCSPHIGHO2_12_FULL_48_16]OGE97776.1 MAG: hypothetical protein A2990_03705 [Candidatus Doudnabacteria bacterium RIFCSPLOWO2_01_FULL_49_40]OGF02573.1 MAG: hypothetical protein A3J07_02000 [Candid